MQKLFVPYEIAKKLRQLGFNEPCFGYYHTDKKFYLRVEGGNTNSSYKPKVYAAPLYQQVVDWFRERHEIQIIELPNIKLSKWVISLNGESKGAFELNKAIEEALKLI